MTVPKLLIIIPPIAPNYSQTPSTPSQCRRSALRSSHTPYPHLEIPHCVPPSSTHSTSTTSIISTAGPRRSAFSKSHPTTHLAYNSPSSASISPQLNKPSSEPYLDCLNYYHLSSPVLLTAKLARTVKTGEVRLVNVRRRGHRASDTGALPSKSANWTQEDVDAVPNVKSPDTPHHSKPPLNHHSDLNWWYEEPVSRRHNITQAGVSKHRQTNVTWSSVTRSPLRDWKALWSSPGSAREGPVGLNGVSHNTDLEIRDLPRGWSRKRSPLPV
ncbi:hypothetical protein BDZ91DRAFT_796429 [Kalaharituber pfeilii]|nr:hypothetical protein BDZ91DRAFT_796429 [Kalaharituber pfeilii]